MAEFWDAAFRDKHMMWGEEPAASALFARDYFLEQHITRVLIPGIGYGRNAKPFLDVGMSVTGIEISQTAIDIARHKMGLSNPIHHGSVSDMPFDDQEYGGVFCYAVIHLLNEDDRQKLVNDCYAQLASGGHMIFVAISKNSPNYGKGTKIGPDRYDQHGGARIFFYDEESIHRQFEDFGPVEIREVMEPIGNDIKTSMSFFVAVLRKR